MPEEIATRAAPHSGSRPLAAAGLGAMRWPLPVPSPVQLAL